MQSPLLTTRQVADLLGVPVATVYQWRHRGTGPRGVRVGRHVRFRYYDVDNWIEQHADSVDRTDELAALRPASAG